jgi:CubicO group peptidase (beta-lactamase class C family)
MQLVEKGNIRLDDDLAKVIPQLKIEVLKGFGDDGKPSWRRKPS